MTHRRFIYKLQNILNAREAEKRAREMELAAANRALREEEARLEQVLDRVARAMRPPDYAPTAFFFVQREKHLRILRVEREARANAVKMAKLNVEDRREKVIDASVEVKKFEKHKDRAKDDWQEDYNRWEQRNNDEISNVLVHMRPPDPG